MGLFDSAPSVQEALAASRARRRKRRPPPSLDDLRSEVSLLEAEQAQFGAPEIEQDKPGVFRTIVDLLSRPNFAIAGLTEELFVNKRSVTTGATRALAEIFSGLGGIEGQKRAFGEVFERGGVPTITLAEAFPALEGTWIGNFGSRGAAGIAADIFLDPLTYVGLGTLKAGKIVSRVGGKPVVRFLNQAGIAERSRITKEIFESLGPDVTTAERRLSKQFFGETDDFSLRRTRTKLQSEIERRTSEFLTDPSTGDIAKQFLEPGGVRFFGKSVASAETIRKFYQPVVRAAGSVPGGDIALETARVLGDGIKGAVNQMFSPWGELGHLPAGEFEVARRLRRDFMNAAAVHRMRLIPIAKQLETTYRKLEKKNPLIGKKWYDIREGVRPNDLVGEEREVFDQTMSFYDSMRDTLLAHGVLTEEQIRRGYIFHAYQNIQDLRKYHWNDESPFSGIISEQFTKERAFDRFEDAVLESRRLNAIQSGRSIGKSLREYPVLIPEYDVFKNLGRYINSHSDALARKAWREEAAQQFGRSIDDFDINAIYDVHVPIVPLDSAVGKSVNNWFIGTTRFKDAVEVAAKVMRIDSSARADISEVILELANAPNKAKGFTKKNKIVGESIAEKLRLRQKLSGLELLEARRIALEQRGQAERLILARNPSRAPLDFNLGKPRPLDQVERSVIKSARAKLRSLPEGGKREFLRRMLTGANSSSQLASMESGLWDEFGEFFPRSLVQSVKDGEIHRPLASTLGERAAEMIPVKTAWTGGVGLHLPRAVYDDMARVNTTLLNTSDFKEFGKMMRAFDWFNNRFKIGVYTLWPASAFRDVYSNIALSMYDIGLQALNPAYHKDAIKILSAGTNKRLMSRFGDDIVSGTDRTIRQLVREAEDFGVWVPGEVFAELAGDPKTAGTFLRKAANMRGYLENEARVLLWLANIRRGASSRASADHVAEFLFNYGEVSRIEREVFRRLIPFYTFTRKNVELQSKILIKNPGMSINQLKPFRGRTEENEQMVQWEAEALKMRMDRDGKTVHMLTGIDLPLRNLDTLWRGDLSRTGRSIMGMVTPLVKTIPEVLLNHDFFLGRDLTRTQSGAAGRLIETLPTPQPVKDWLGYKKKVDDAGRPTYTFDGKRFTLLFRSWMFSRAFSTSDRQFRENMTNGGVEWQRMALDVFTGLRRKEVDMDEQMRRRMNDRIRQLEQSLARRGARERFSRSFVPSNRGELQ